MMKDDEAIATVITALSASISLWVGHSRTTFVVSRCSKRHCDRFFKGDDRGTKFWQYMVRKHLVVPKIYQSPYIPVSDIDQNGK